MSVIEVESEHFSSTAIGFDLVESSLQQIRSLNQLMDEGTFDGHNDHHETENDHQMDKVMADKKDGRAFSISRRKISSCLTKKNQRRRNSESPKRESNRSRSRESWKTSIKK